MFLAVVFVWSNQWYYKQKGVDGLLKPYSSQNGRLTHILTTWKNKKITQISQNLFIQKSLSIGNKI